MVKTLKIGPYTVRVVPLYAGPLLEVKGEADALAELINHGVELTSLGLAAAIEGKREAGDQIVYVSPPANADEDRTLREAWARRSGERCGAGEVARVGMMGREEPLAVSWDALRKGLVALCAIRSEWQPDPGPWLFARPTKAPFVTPEDFEIVKQLEAEATAIDELDLEAEVGREPETLLARRREFLLACRDAGVFANEHAAVRDQWLHDWSAVRLQALRHAAKLLATWDVLAEDEEPPDGRVCLDFVRLELWPPGEDGESWARSALELFAAPLEGDQGVVIERVGSSTISMWWRRDGDIPALLAIERV